MSRRRHTPEWMQERVEEAQLVVSRIFRTFEESLEM